MPIRELTDTELNRLKLLSNETIEVSLIHLTETMLRKSIIDATGPVRAFLVGHEIHDFDQQGRGAKEHGVKLRAQYFNDVAAKSLTVSLYKPNAKPNKGGDPRICIYGLKKLADAGDILAILDDGDRLGIINITRLDLAAALTAGSPSKLSKLIERASASSSDVANELLGKLRELAALGPIKSVMTGMSDTAVGRTLEHHLGISMNSKKDPDYKGIELKSARVRKRKPRAQLFGQVPNWSMSKLKSSAQVLAAFGRGDGASRRLNSTVRATGFNPDGLSFDLESDGTLLHEVSSKEPNGRFATWEIKHLQGRLATKHSETFWIKAESSEIQGEEHFKFVSVVHTRKPIVGELASLLEVGAITMDHQIRMKDGKPNERGPSFKINPSAFDILFPPNKSYELE